MIRFALLLFAGACAPPLGVGPAPSTPPRSGMQASVASSYAFSSSRESLQGSGSVAGRFRERILLETGIVATTTRLVKRGRPPVLASGAFPYLRPTLVLGDVQVGVALAGAAIGAGGGGAYFGIAEARVGFARGPLSVWTSTLASAAETIGGPRSRGRHLAFGSEWQIERRGTRIGLGAEVRVGDESLACGESCTQPFSLDDRFSALVLKLRIVRGGR